MKQLVEIGEKICDGFRLGNKVLFRGKIATIVGYDAGTYSSNDYNLVNTAIDISEGIFSQRQNIKNACVKDLKYIETNKDVYSWVNPKELKLFRESLVLDYAYFKDECVAKIIYQDEKIYHRLTFEDEEYNVKNKPYPDYDKNTKTIYIRGTMKNSDNRCFSIPLSDVDDFKRRIDEINKKYDSFYKEQDTDLFEKYVTDINKSVMHDKDDTKTATIRKLDYPNKILLEDSEIYKIKKRLDKIETILNIEED